MRIGAHVSTSGGVHTAITRAVDIGANCVQIFAGAPQRWAEPRFSDADVECFRKLSEEHDVRPAFIHSAYLLNFASQDSDLRMKSVTSLVGALRWAERLGVAGVITHLGSSRDGDLAQAEAAVGECMEQVLEQAPSGPWVIVETCAGQGNTIGRRFEQIGSILEAQGSPYNLRVCLDTAHTFEAGYDITTRDGFEDTMEQFDRFVGISKLAAIHVNDSKTPLGSNVDRHENIGFGHLGEEAFGRILNEPYLRTVPFLLEVPGMAKEGPDRPNIDALRRLAGLL